MSTPDSVLSSVLLPTAPRLTVVPAPVPRSVGLSRSLAALPPVLVATAGLVVIQTVALFASRILAVELSYDYFIDSTVTATALGAVSFLSIVLVSSAIVLGHAALRATRESSVWMRQAAAIAAGAAYLHLILWGMRVIAGAFAASSAGTGRAVPAQRLLVGLRHSTDTPTYGLDPTRPSARVESAPGNRCMRMWRSGSASPCQGEGREFESRHPLE